MKEALASSLMDFGGRGMNLQRGGRRFPKSLRVRRNAEYLKIYTGGKKFHDACLTLVVLGRPEAAPARFGFSVSRKVGNAVVRNKLKRRLREIYRLNQALFKPGFDLVATARPAAARLSYQALEENLLKLCKQAGLVS